MREAREPLRPHLGVRGHVGRALGERRAHEQEALAVADDGLVREVDEDLGAGRAQRGAHAVEHHVRRGAARLHRVQPRHPDLGSQGGEPGALVAALPRAGGAVRAAQLLAAAGEHARLDRVRAPQPRHRGRYDGWVMFAVDEHDGARQATVYLLSSWSRQMYLSKAAVDGTKSISSSSPWNGYLRATRTRSSSMRMRL